MSGAERLAAALGGRYDIERELGQGGMATVYLAQDIRHDRKVALKVLKPELAAVLGAERFVVEIKTTASLQHPHILPLFDSGTANGFLYYVMPFIEGETLRDKLNRETQLGIEEAVRITSAVADALDYAHRHGVIHRDIKPENILLHDGQPMVADFGIALAVSAAAGGRMTETGLSLGTPHYMSPEQATAEKDISARSDIYSLGSVLYEMLTGNPPHTGAAAQQIIMKIITEPAEPVTKYRKSVPPNVAAALSKALEKLPADRFPTASAFGSALVDSSFRHGSVASSATGSPASVRNRLPWIVAAAAVLLAVAGWIWRPAGARRPEASFVAVSLAAPRVSLSTLVDRFAVSPSGDAIVFSNDFSLFVRRLGQILPVPLPVGAAHSPTFSPDGRWLAFVVTDSRVMKVPVDGHLPPSDVVKADGLAGMLSWGPDDRIRIPRLRSGVLLSVPASGGSPDSIVFQGDTTVWRGELLGGGRLLISIITGSKERIVVREPDGRTRELLSGLDGRVAQPGHLLFSRRAGRGWSLAAAPFDASNGTLSGPAVVLVESVPTAWATPGVASRDGDLFYMEGTPRTDRRIVVVDRSGRVSDTPFKPGPWTSVSTSHQGSRVLANLWNGAERTIWSADLSTGTVAQLTFEGDRFVPIWSPDGRRIAYSYGKRGAGEKATLLWWTAVNGSGAEEALTQDPDGFPGGFAPDGSTHYYRSENRQTARDEIWAADLTSTARTRRPLVANPANNETPTPSPDGRWLAFATDVSGRVEARIGRLPNLANPVQVSTGGGQPVGWRQDGRRFFYSDGSVVWEVEVGPGGPIPGSARRAFTLPQNSRAVAITADGERLVVVQGGDMYSDLAVIQGALKR